MKHVVLAAVLLPSLCTAEEWRRLAGHEIRAALEGRRVVYESGAWQEFRTSGRTLYNAGRDSWGYWQVRDDTYCSMWPPSDLWACYRVEGTQDGIRFIGASGEVKEGRYDD